ncbi:zinc-dependent metalloprotease [Algoriphagus aestuarii]|nr:zinc-dependent metalloprotease [Algoriphagus aestuarii]
MGDAILIRIPRENGDLDLELIKVSDSFYSYDLITSEGEKFESNKNYKHYRGVVKGENASLVAFSFSESEVIGLVARDEGNFNFAKTLDGEKYVFFNEMDLLFEEYSEVTIEKGNDYKIETFKEYPQEVLSQESKLSFNSSDKCVRFYFETEFDIFQNKGTVANVEFFVSSIYNQVGLLYQNENIGTYISRIFVWTSTDPYVGTDLEDYLDEFQTVRTSFEGDLGQLLTFRGTSFGGGNAQGIEGLCNSDVKEKSSVAQIKPTFNNFPVYSRPVKVMTHEFGHLLGSRHTHDCVWGSNNNSAIDSCVTPGCPGAPIPSLGGTIMSYCDQPGKPGVNFTFGFGTQPGNVIRNSVANATCFCNCVGGTISGSSYLCSTNSYSLTNPPSGSSITWSVSPTNLFSGSTSGTGYTASLTSYHSSTRGQAILTFKIINSCGEYLYNKPIWVQAPLSPGSIIGNNSPGPGSISPYMVASLPSGATSMSWSLPYCVGCSQPWTFYAGQNSTQMTANVGDAAGYIQAMGVNPCGTGGASLLYVTPSGGCDPCARTFPNPVSNEMTLEWFNKDGILINDEVPNYKITLYNAVGGVIITESSNSPFLNFDLSQLKNGFYFLHIENKDGLIRKQIKVER